MIGARFTGLRVSLGERPVLHDVTCAIHPMRRTAIVGPNGGGKTTLMRVLLGLLAPDAGTVSFQDGTGHEVPRPRIGYLPQRTSLELDAPVSGLDLIGLTLDQRAGFRTPAPVRAQASEALGRAGLSPELVDRPIGRLSGGQRQRVLLARAIAGAPPILVLDEPDTALDAEGMKTLRRLVVEEVARGATVVYVTHDAASMGGADEVLRVDGEVRAEEAEEAEEAETTP